MIGTLAAIVLWLVAGHALVAGIFWGLVQVPESNVLMLALSALLALLMLAVVGWVETAAALMWVRPSRFSEHARRGAAALPAVIMAAAVFGAAWWLTGWLSTSAAARSGEIDAWLMARFGWTRTRWIHEVLGWAIWFVRYPVGLSLALGISIGAALDGWRPLLHFGWVPRALAPVRLARVAFWLLALVWLPWQAVDWRPRALPPTWLEPAFVGAKLLAIYVIANIGWALVLRAATPAAPRGGIQDSE